MCKLVNSFLLAVQQDSNSVSEPKRDLLAAASVSCPKVLSSFVTSSGFLTLFSGAEAVNGP